MVLLGLFYFLFFNDQEALVLWTHAQTLENGLSQSTISCMVQDQKGFIWLGTQDGLNRFDGYQYKVYRPEQGNPHSIGSPGVQALLTAQDGSLWIGTYQGLNHYIPSKEWFIRYQQEPGKASLVHDDIRCLIEDKLGNIWIGTRGGLSRFNPEKEQFDTFLPSQAGGSDSVLAIAQAGEILWVGTDSGYACLNLPVENWLKSENRFSGLAIQAILVQADGSVILGSQDGLRALDPAGHAVGQINGHSFQLLAGYPINALLPDDENLWIATEGKGLVYFDPQLGFRPVVDPPDSQFAISDLRISSLMHDSSGLIWIGTYWRGLRLYNPFSLYFSIRRNEEVPGSESGNRIIRCFLEDQDDSLWIGSEGSGLTHQIEPGRGTIYRNAANDPYSLPDNRVFCLFKDRDEQIWVGMEAGNYSRFLREKKRFENDIWPTTGDRPGPVRAIQQDAAGRVWLGNDGGGLACRDPQSGDIRYFRAGPEQPQGLTYNRIFCLLVDDRNQLWIGTFGGGLDCLDLSNQQFRHIQSQQAAFPLDAVLCLRQVGSDLWIGADGGGLVRLNLDTGAIQGFGADYFPNLTIYGILPDEQGQLWVSHNLGLSAFNPQTGQVQNFDVRDGLQSNEFNGGAVYKSRDGRLFFGGVNGYNVFRGDAIRVNPNPPRLAFTQFEINHQAVRPGQTVHGHVPLAVSISEAPNLVLTPSDLIFSLEFAAFNFAYPQGTQYAVWMEGLDPDWNFIGPRRHISYTTLAPGRYTLHVKAANHHGRWSEREAILHIRVLPPFWRKAWFIILLVGSLTGIILGWVKWRVHSVEGQNRDLENQVRNRTSELAQQNQKLTEALVELGETKDALIEAAHKAGMADTATGVLHNVGNLLNSVNTSAGVIQDQIKRSAIQHLVQANSLLRANLEHIDDFITQNPKGKKLLQYYLELEKAMLTEQAEIRESAERLNAKIEAIREAIAAQQRFAKRHDYFEYLDLSDLVNDALTLQAPSIQRHGIRIEKSFDPVPAVRVQKTKIVQILLNLYQNAKDSMLRAGVQEPCIQIQLRQEGQTVLLRFSDNGEGIAHENLKAIFSYGYTTKVDGHGFGLHNSANYMREMEGEMGVESEGLGHGAAFWLRFTRTLEIEATGRPALLDNNLP